jgi:glycosyltransferase involved in cell wall biosynthesis
MVKILAKPYQLKHNPYTRLYYDDLVSKYGDIKVIPYGFLNFFRRVDIFHIHWPESMLNEKKTIKKLFKLIKFFLILNLMKLRDVKILWTAHNFRPHARNASYILENIFYNKWLKFIDGILFLSDASQKEFFNLYPQNNIISKVIPHGHYIDYYRSKPPTNHLKDLFKIKADDFVIGHYGLIKQYKNTVLLLKEFRKIKNPKIKLIICGKIGNNEKKLHDEICEYAKIDNRVILYLQFVKDSELVDLHGLTDLCVYPYADIVNSGSVLNSLSLGCPVIAPKNPYMSEIFYKLEEKNLFLYENSFSADFLNQILSHQTFEIKSVPKDNLRHYEWEISSDLSYKFFLKILSKSKNKTNC